MASVSSENEAVLGMSEFSLHYSLQLAIIRLHASMKNHVFATCGLVLVILYSLNSKELCSCDLYELLEYTFSEALNKVGDFISLVCLLHLSTPFSQPPLPLVTGPVFPSKYGKIRMVGEMLGGIYSGLLCFLSKLTWSLISEIFCFTDFEI